jgi:hypothetical protein
MKTKIFIFVIFLSFLNVPIFGQPKSDTANKNSIKYKCAIGFGAGYTIGYEYLGLSFEDGMEDGISFKYTPNKFGIQTTFSPYYDERKTRLSIGLTLLYNLIKVEKTTFYLYQGNHFIYSNYYNSNSETKGFNNGMGLGIEIIILKRVGFNLMFGYTFYNNFAEFRRRGKAGLYYKF